MVLASRANCLIRLGFAVPLNFTMVFPVAHGSFHVPPPPVQLLNTGAVVAGLLCG
jgi:hypothetical protein